MRSTFAPALALAAASLASAGEPPKPPPAIAAPAGERLLLRARALGVQIYTCAPSARDAAKLEWTLVAPEAQLRDERDRPIGKHYAGPTWEANDGSKVVGQVIARAPMAGTIPWLLLRGTPSGKGVLGAVSSIQRVDTSGGAAPSDGCDDKHRGASARVPYTAIYKFFGKYSSRSRSQRLKRTSV